MHATLQVLKKYAVKSASSLDYRTIYSRDIEWFTDCQVFCVRIIRVLVLPLPYPPPPPPVSKLFLMQSSCVSPVKLTDGSGGGRGWARSQII
jgi:hypothetical protein